jgi:hypothetical protein
MSDTRVRYVGGWDEKKGLLELAPRTTPDAKPIALRCVRPAPDRLEIEGTLDGHRVLARLHKLDASKFLLLARGFHWINEYPFNR